MSASLDIEATARAAGEAEAVELMRRIAAGEAGIEDLAASLTAGATSIWRLGGHSRLEGLTLALMNALVERLRQEGPQ